MHEYVSKEVLDLLVCVAVRAFVTPDNKLKVAVAGGGGGPLAGWAAASSPAAQQQQQATAGGGGSDAAAGGGSGIAPVYLLNDVNLMTVMESVKLFMDIY